MLSVNKVFCCLFLISLSLSSWAQDTLPDNAERVRYYHSNGVLSSSGYLVDGQPDGYWRTFYSSGILKSEGNRLNKQLSGIWKFYDQLGVLYLEISYQNGLKNGFRSSYKDSTLFSREWFKEDVKDSISIYYFASGDVKKSIPWVQGEEEGLGFEYRQDGTIITLQFYRSGILVRNEAINRLDEQGRKQGLYKSFYLTGILKEEGTYLNDLKDGYFKYYYEDGTLNKTERYELGVLIEDPLTAKIRYRQEFHDNGTLSHEGTYRKSVKDGVHIYYDDEGNTLNAQLFGMGKLLAEGMYDKEGRKQGVWKEFYEDGTVKAEGKYRDDKKVETWKYFFTDSKLEQIGSYRVGNPHGVWKWYYNNGQIRKEEEWFNGYRDGIMLEYDSLGNQLVRGNFRENLQDGRWQISINDYEAIGNYRDGLETGVWKFYYDKRKIMYDGEFVDGIPNGKHISYYYNGNVKEIGSYDYGVKIGTWMRYSEDGQLILSISYKKGEEVGYDGVQVSDLELSNPVN